MSYSRWSHSCWYTYSDARTVNGEDTLNINCDERYPISRLRDDKAAVLEHYRQLRFERNPLNYKGEGEPPKDHYTEDEIKELGDIIDYFIHDHTNGITKMLQDIALKDTTR